MTHGAHDKCVSMQMRDAREFYGVSTSPRYISAKAQTSEPVVLSADVSHEQCGPNPAAVLADRRPRHPARRRLHLGADATGFGGPTAEAVSSRDSNGGQIVGSETVLPMGFLAPDGLRLVAGSAAKPADHTAGTSQPAAAIRPQMPTMLRRRTGVPDADDSPGARQIVGGQTEALLPSPTADGILGSGLGSDNDSLQGVSANSGAAPSSWTAASLSTGGPGSGLLHPDAARSTLQLPNGFVDGSHPSLGPTGAQTLTPLDVNLFEDVGGVGAESPGSSDAEGPSGALTIA